MGQFAFMGTSAGATRNVWKGKLRRGLGRRPLRSRPVLPSLNSLQGARAVLLTAWLDRAPLQVMAHGTFPGTGHEVSRAARIGPKRSRQRLRLDPWPEQGQERVPDPNPQWQQGITHLARQDKGARSGAPAGPPHAPHPTPARQQAHSVGGLGLLSSRPCLPPQKRGTGRWVASCLI